MALGALLSPIFEPYDYNPTQISTLGVIFIISGVISCLIVGRLLDYYYKFLLTLRIVCWGSTAMAIVAIFVFPLGNIYLTAILMVLAGVLILPIIPVCISFACEVTFPMQAAMINGGVQLSGHLIGFLMEVIASYLVTVSTLVTLIFFAASGLIGAIFTIFIVEQLLRK